MRYSSKVWVHIQTNVVQQTKPTNNPEAWIQWDSMAEYTFFKDVLTPVAHKLNLEIVRQYPVEILKSAYFGKYTWKVDFCLRSKPTYSFKSEVIALVEYKGDWVLHKFPDLKKLLLLLEANKKLHYLIMVGSSALKTRLKGITCIEDTKLGNKYIINDLTDAVKSLMLINPMKE